MRASPAPGCAHSKTHSVRLIAEALGGRDTWIVSSEQNARYGTHQGNLVLARPPDPRWLCLGLLSAATAPRMMTLFPLATQFPLITPYTPGEIPRQQAMDVNVYGPPSAGWHGVEDSMGRSPLSRNRYAVFSQL